MKKIDAILICGSCHSVFDGRDMLTPCPKCGGKISRAMTTQGLLDIFDDAEAMDTLMETEVADRAIEAIYEAGYEYDPNYCSPKRFVKIDLGSQVAATVEVE